MEKKTYLIRVGNIAMWLYCFLVGSEIMSLLFRNLKLKEIKKGFLELSCDALQTVNKHVNYLREMIIYCIHTVILSINCSVVLVIVLMIEGYLYTFVIFEYITHTNRKRMKGNNLDHLSWNGG